MQKITPFLWFNGNAEDAMNFYVSVFKNAKAGTIQRYGPAGPGKAGDVMSVTFEIEGQEFYALNGGDIYQITPGISFFINCNTQEEIDHLWEKLPADGGKTMACGWLTDRYGVTWQVVPGVLSKMLHDNDKERVQRVMRVMMQMTKFDIAALEAANEGR